MRALAPSPRAAQVSPSLARPALAVRPARRCASRRSGRAALRAPRAASGGGDGGGGGRQPWDFGRFVKTFAFFNLPTVADLLASLSPKAPLPVPLPTVPGSPAASAMPLAAAAAATSAHLFTDLSGAPLPPFSSSGPAAAVLVTGASGGVGARVTRLLLSRGVPVRALVRDLDAARAALAACPGAAPAAGLLAVRVCDVAAGPAALGGAALGRGVRAAVTCHSARVQPKEGDTPDRQKYLQGIKFYDPEIVGAPPSQVEAGGMASLLDCLRPALLAARGAPAPEAVLFDAQAAGGRGGCPEWGPLDDVVMGGTSASAFALAPGAGEGGGRRAAGVFAGVASTANSGGFASARTRNWGEAGAPDAAVPSPAAAAASAGLALRVRGDGRRYKLFLRQEPGWDAVAYGAGFDAAPPGEWVTARLPWAAFRPVFRGRTVAGAPPLDPAKLRSMQLMLSKFESDGLLNPRFGGAGAFELRVERIATYNAPAPSADDGAAPLSWVHISSAGVTRPHRPGIDVAVEPPAVRMNAMLGNLLDHKLAAEDALRSSAPGLRAAIVRPTALTEEPLGAPLVVAQGDTIRGKVARDEVAALAVDLLTAVPTPLPAGGTFTFEIASTVPFSTPWTGPEDGGAAPQRDWADLLAPLKAGVTGRTMGGVYTGDKPEAEALAAAAAAAGAGAQPPAGVGARA